MITKGRQGKFESNGLRIIANYVVSEGTENGVIAFLSVSNVDCELELVKALMVCTFDTAEPQQLELFLTVCNFADNCNFVFGSQN